MKATKTLTFLLAALTMTACSYDDSELRNQINQNTERIAALEAWQAETNTNIQSLQTLLNTTDYITAVTPIVENGVEVGYTISFLNSPAITIYHGKNGDKGDKGENGITPQIGVTQGGDGNWYWTLNSELMTDEQGNPIRANGETGATGASAPAPQLATGANLTNVTTDTQGNAIAPEAIYLSVDDGRNWTRVSGEKGEQGDRGQGQSLFSSVDLETDPTSVIFTLADGTTFSVFRYLDIKLVFGTTKIRMNYGDELTINFTAEGSDRFTPDNLFVVVPDGWKATAPVTRTANATEFSMTITSPTKAQLATGIAVDEGEILVMLDNRQGSTTVGRIEVESNENYLAMDNVSAGQLASTISDRYVTSITVVSGEINDDDWEAVAIRKRLLLYIDLAGATYTGTNGDNLTYNDEELRDIPLIDVKLPQGITGLGNSIFYCGHSLTSVAIPNEVTNIAANAFYNCYKLTSIDLPDELISIGRDAFAACGALTSIIIPAKVTQIGDGAFSHCPALASITCLAETPPSLGPNSIAYCDNLTHIYVPAGSVDAYKAIRAWSYCAEITPIP